MKQTGPGERKMLAMPYRLTIDLSDAYAAKLRALAETRKRSPEQCILDFLAACQPGGSGWRNPADDHHEPEGEKP